MSVLPGLEWVRQWVFVRVAGRLSRGPMWPDVLADVDVGAIGRKAQWVDLDGEGLPGLLTREAGGFRYHRNLSSGKLARGREIRTEPSLGAEAAQMVDLDGSGIPSLVTFESSTPGTFLRDGEDWGAFRPFHELPNVDWQSAQVKHVDLDGDGRDDLLVVTRDSSVDLLPPLKKRGLDILVSHGAYLKGGWSLPVRGRRMGRGFEAAKGSRASQGLRKGVSWTIQP